MEHLQTFLNQEEYNVIHEYSISISMMLAQKYVLVHMELIVK